jgi:alpha-tubulin suppressor-like RCC1 family protein
VFFLATPQHGACVTAGGAVLTWGKGERGQLGLGKFENAAEPKPCPLVADARGWPTCDRVGGGDYADDDERSWRASDVRAWPGQPTAVAVSCGFCHTAALTADGEVFVWGKHLSLKIAGETVDSSGGSGGGAGAVDGDESGGDGGFLASLHAMRALVAKHDDQPRPRKLRGLPRPAVAIACSAFHTTVLTDDGQVWCVGMRFGSRTTAVEPVLLRAPQPPRAAEGAATGGGSEGEDLTRQDVDSAEPPQRPPPLDLASALALAGDRAVGLRGGPAATGSAVLTAAGQVVTALFDGSGDGQDDDYASDGSSPRHGDGRLPNGDLPMTAAVSLLPGAWPPRLQQPSGSGRSGGGGASAETVADVALGWQHGLLLTK